MCRYSCKVRDGQDETEGVDGGLTECRECMGWNDRRGGYLKAQESTGYHRDREANWTDVKWEGLTQLVDEISYRGLQTYYLGYYYITYYLYSTFEWFLLVRVLY